MKYLLIFSLLITTSIHAEMESADKEITAVPFTEQTEKEIGYFSELFPNPKRQSITINKSSKFGKLIHIYLIHGHHGEISAKLQPKNELGDDSSKYKVDFQTSAHFARHSYFEVCYQNPESKEISVIKIGIN